MPLYECNNIFVNYNLLVQDNEKIFQDQEDYIKYQKMKSLEEEIE